jgi:hypothetical protein
MAEAKQIVRPTRMGARLRSWVRGHATHVWIGAPLLVYVCLVVVGVNQSSMGLDALRQDPADPIGFQLGQSLPIRSDEAYSGSPQQLAVIATGSEDDFNPLTVGPGALVGRTQGIVSSVVLIDRTILRLGPFLPAASVFAAAWWWPTLLLFLGAPALFRRLVGSRPIGLFAALLIYFCPANAWWSMVPSVITAFAVAGSAALMAARDRWLDGDKVRAGVWGVVSAALLTHTAFHYQLWVIVLLPGVLIPVVAALLAERERRRATMAVVGAVGALTVALLGAILWENRDVVGAMANTVYPGRREFTGVGQFVGSLFGATALGNLEYQPPQNTNQSEITSGFNILVVLVVVLVALGGRPTGQARRWAFAAISAVVACWLVWMTVNLGAVGYATPLFSVVSTDRARQVVGCLIVVQLCLLLPGLPRRSVRQAAAGAVLIGWLAAWAASDLSNHFIPQYRTSAILLSAVGVAVVAFALIWRPDRPAGYVLATLGALALVARVNPIMIGLPDLRESEAAASLRAEGVEARAAGTVWATDSLLTDTVLMANGVPSLTGRMMAAPDREQWLRLDPDDTQEKVWNRGGGTFIWASWEDRADIELASPNPDIVVIKTSPCALGEVFPELGHIVASRELDEGCLVADGQFTWAGAPRYVYEVV